MKVSDWFAPHGIVRRLSKRLLQVIAESRKAKDLTPSELAQTIQKVSHAKQTPEQVQGQGRARGRERGDENER